MTLGKSIKKGKIGYAKILMGSTETVFSHYRMIYLLEHIMNHDKLLLDVGCGAGNKINNISKNFDRLKIIGVDVSRVALMYAHKNNNRAHFLRADAEKLPIRDESVDYIVSFDLLEHLPDPKKAMGECHRVLKKGGIFHSFIPCEGEKLLIVRRSRIFQLLKRKHAGHIQYFTKQEIRHELKNAGFSVTDEKHSFFYFAQLIDLFIYLFVDLSGIRPDEKEDASINLVRSLVRILISKIDLEFSNRFPNHSMGFHVTARKQKMSSSRVIGSPRHALKEAN